LKKIVVLMFALLLIVAGCGTTTNNESGQDVSNNEGSTNGSGEKIRVVEIETTKGKIVVNLDSEAAPKAVENFVTHAENGYYDGLIFHRVIKDFMLQTGDPQGNGTGGESIWGQPFEDEVDSGLNHVRGALSMANSGPNTNGSQFFIVQASEVPESMISEMEKAGFPEEDIETYKEKGGTPWLDGRHTVFGEVVEGMDVVDEIAAVEVGPNDKPVEDVLIEKMTVVK
jgi:peptidyl-prolyl cis-trans isomerase B (cyclophilin B)